MSISLSFNHANKLQNTVPTDMKRVAAIILGGGKGTRLFPLTESRCKPAISFGGRCRLIDIPISNSINSGCHKIFLITQFLSSSLHQHIFQTYRHDVFSGGFIEILSAEQRPSKHDWFQGTADAVRQNLDYIIDTPVDYFLILSGDQLYKMDFLKMLQFARERDADLVVGALPIKKEDTKRMGILKMNKDNLITGFVEKPQEESELLPFINPLSPHEEKPFLGSMGIYLFKRETLLKLLNQDLREDFGKHLIPTKVALGSTLAYIFDDYWEDIGTIGSFYEANMDLTSPNPPFDFYDEEWPIFSHRNYLQGPKLTETLIHNSIIGEGSLVEAEEITHSILGPRTVIHKGTHISHSYLLGNDFYEPPIHTGRMPESLYIGENCHIRGAIIDKHVRIGNRVQLTNKNNLENYNGGDIYIRDGIIIVPRGVTLPDGFEL